jgi:hypothetical protein
MMALLVGRSRVRFLVQVRTILSGASQQHLELRLAGILAEFVEDRFRVFQEDVGTIKLGNHTGIHDKDAVRINNGVETVSNGENGAVTEMLLQHMLDGRVGVGIQSGSGLVQEQDAGRIQHGARQANELLRSERKVGAQHLHLGLQTVLIGLQHGREQALVQNFQNLVVRAFVEGIEVSTQSATEHDGLLGDNGHAAAQRVEADGRTVH